MIRPLPYDQMSVTFGVRSRAQYIELLITVGLFAAVVGLFSPGWFYDFAREGISTVGAERILAGEIPYRDFWTMYAPGQFYLLALLFKIFGAHLLVEVVASSIICAAAVCVCYRLIFNLVGRKLAALAPSVILLAAFYNTGYFKRLGSYPPAFLFILLAVNFLLQYCRNGNIRYLLAAGLATGTTLVFKHDVGCYTAIAIMAGFTAHHILTPAPMAESVSSLGRKLLCYAVGLVAVALPVLAYFAVLAGPDMLKDLVIFPLTDFRFARPEGYPNLFPFGIYNRSFLKMVDNLFTYINL